MSQQARETARRIVAEVLATQHRDGSGAHASDATPAAVPNDGRVAAHEDGPVARRARALVAAVFDPEPAPPPPPADPLPPTPLQLRARALVEEAVSAQAARAQPAPREDQPPIPAPPVAPPQRPTAPAKPVPSAAGDADTLGNEGDGTDEAGTGTAAAGDRNVDGILFAERDGQQQAGDRLFPATADTRVEESGERHELPPSLREDVAGPPAPPVAAVGGTGQVHGPAVPAVPAAEPPRADLAARLVSEVLDETGGPAQVPTADPDPAREERDREELVEDEPVRIGRWLLVTAIAAITLALLFPLAVAAVRELLSLA